MYIYHWTFGAIECYERNLTCSPECSNYSTCFKYLKINKKPPMKDAVIMLVKRAIPFKKRKGYGNYENYYEAD